MSTSSVEDRDQKIPIEESTSPRTMEDGVTQKGARNMEAVGRVWGTTSKVWLFIGIALVAYVYSLDGTTSYLYLAFATSSFSQHTLLSSISVAQAIILAVAKPPSAKIADVFGRAEAYFVSVCLYVIGYIVVASSNSVGAYAGGIIIYAAGQASIQILQVIIIADVTTLKWRGLVTSLTTAPYFINAFVGSNIGAAVNAGAGWRWGYAMFTIIIPVASAPIIITLAWAQQKAKKLGLIATSYNSESVAIDVDSRPIAQRVYTNVSALDLFGLLLFAAGFSLLLIPLTLVNRAQDSFGASLISMIVIGCLLLVAFAVYEAKVAKSPIMPFRFFKSPTVVACCLIGFFDFISFYLQFTYQYSFIFITHQDWTNLNQNYFAQIQTLSLSLFAILAGVYQLYYRKFKWMLFTALCVRLIGVGAMIYTKGAHGSTAGLVITQIVQGAGGGAAACASQVGIQGSVTHQDVAGAIAIGLLFAEIGGAIGTTIAGSIWRNTMPGELANNLSGLLNSTEIDGIFGSITTAATYPQGGPVYLGVVAAYDTVMFRLLVAATVLAIPPVIAALFVVDFELGDKMNSLESDPTDPTDVKEKDLEQR